MVIGRSRSLNIKMQSAQQIATRHDPKNRAWLRSEIDKIYKLSNNNNVKIAKITDRSLNHRMADSPRSA